MMSFLFQGISGLALFCGQLVVLPTQMQMVVLCGMEREE